MRSSLVRRLGVAFLAAACLCMSNGGALAATQAGKTAALGSTVAAAPQASAHDDMQSYLNGLQLLNYYPVRHSWATMWTQWDPGAISSDFGHAAFLHANAIRIIVPAPTFGYPTPQPAMLDRLATVIGLAQQHHLRVQLTLFDAWLSYHDIAGSEQWARAVLAPYRGDRRLAFVEPRNEIYPFDPATMMWARQMAGFIHQLLPGTPVTYSTSARYGVRGTRALAAALGGAIDFYSFHYYDAAAPAYAVFAQARAAVAPQPLYIGETGFASIPNNGHVDGIPADSTAEEYYQDYYYRTVQEAADRLGLPPVAVWDLNDFAPGTIPSATQNQSDYHYGLYRPDGTLKPVAWSVRTFFLSRSVHPAFNAGFEQGYSSGSSGTSLPIYWRMTSGAHFAQDLTVAHTGRASARISQSGAGSGVLNAPAFYIAPIDQFVAPGQQSSVGAWVRGAQATGATTVVLSWFDASGKWLTSADSAALPAGTTGWMWLSASGTAPAKAAYVQTYLHSANNSGTVWFDDVSVR